MKTTLALTTLLFSLLAYAGDEIGNGGDLVVCQDVNANIKSATILDYYEARHREISLDLGSDELMPMQKVELALNRLFEKNNFFANQLRQKAQTFFQNANIMPNIDLTDIPDGQELFLEHGCSIAQIAINRKVIFPQDKKFIISKDLWDLLDNNNKAGLILHEIIYDYFIQHGHTNSRSARYLNSLISSNQFENYSLEEYQDLKKLLKLKYLPMKIWDDFKEYDLQVGKIYIFESDGPAKIYYSPNKNDYCLYEKKTVEMGTMHPFFDRFKVFEHEHFENLLEGDEKYCKPNKDYTFFNITNKKQSSSYLKDFARRYQDLEDFCSMDSHHGYNCLYSDLRNFQETSFKLNNMTYKAHRFQRYTQEVNKKTGEIRHLINDYTISLVNPHLTLEVFKRVSVNGEVVENMKLTGIKEGQAPLMDAFATNNAFYNAYFNDGGEDISMWSESENWQLLNVLAITKERDERRTFENKDQEDQEKLQLKNIFLGEMIGEIYKMNSCRIARYADYVVTQQTQDNLFTIAKLDRYAKILSYRDLNQCQKQLKMIEEGIANDTTEVLNIQVLNKDEFIYQNKKFTYTPWTK